MEEIINVFLDDAPRQIAGLKNAMELKDCDLVKKHAHTFKGAAGSVRATLLQQLAIDLEEACKNNELEKVVELIETIEIKFSDFVKLCDSILKKQK